MSAMDSASHEATMWAQFWPQNENRSSFFCSLFFFCCGLMMLPRFENMKLRCIVSTLWSASSCRTRWSRP